MKQYLDLLDRILKEGWERNDRTGTGTIGVFGHMMRFPMKDGFPLLTTKKLHLKSITYELLWFLQGGTNIKYLNDHNVTIWDEWADPETGDLGKIYGFQWRSWGAEYRDYILEPDGYMQLPAPTHYYGGIDQIANAIDTLKTNPDSRRIMVSAWNVGDLDKMRFPPCHYGFQIDTRELSYKERLEIAKYDKSRFSSREEWIEFFEKSVQENPSYYGIDYSDPNFVLTELDVPTRAISLAWNQRSVDTFLGLPFNIASYAMLLLMIAQVVNMVPEDLVCFLGDTHLYKNHIEQAKLQLTREPRPLPRMLLNPDVKNIDDFKFEDFQLVDYDPHPHIKGDISV